MIGFTFVVNRWISTEQTTSILCVDFNEGHFVVITSMEEVFSSNAVLVFNVYTFVPVPRYVPPHQRRGQPTRPARTTQSGPGSDNPSPSPQQPSPSRLGPGPVLAQGNRPTQPTTGSVTVSVSSTEPVIEESNENKSKFFRYS